MEKKGIGNKIKTILSKKNLPIILSILAILISLPTLNKGLQLDDVGHKLLIQKKSPLSISQKGTIYGMYTFADGNPENLKKSMDKGFSPWWALPTGKISFWRLLGEVTHFIDYNLWPNSPTMMYVQNILWYALLIFFITILFQRIHGIGWLAGIIALLFTIDDAHANTAGWIASRYYVIAALFGVITLIFHDKWRKDGFKPGLLLAMLFLTLGLFTGEAALATGAYLFAYALFLDTSAIKGKIISILPYGLIILTWMFLYKYLGFGTFGSGWYIDPAREPLIYLKALIDRAPIFLLGQWLGFPSDLYSYLPPHMAKNLWIVAIIIFGLILTILIPFLKKDKISRFWFLGMVLSLIPICTTVTYNRVLMFVGIGGMALMGQIMYNWFEKTDLLSPVKAWKILTKTFVVIFIIINIAISFILYPVSINIDYSKKINTQVNLKILGPDNPGQHLILVNPPDYLYLFIYRLEKGLPIPQYIRALAPATVPTQITRTNKNTLQLFANTGLYTFIEEQFRGRAHALKAGEVIHLTGLTINIIELTKNEIPKKVEFIFDKPLEDKSLKFLEWKQNDYVLFQIPKIGQTVQMSSQKIQ